MAAQIPSAQVTSFVFNIAPSNQSHIQANTLLWLASFRRRDHLRLLSHPMAARPVESRAWAPIWFTTSTMAANAGGLQVCPPRAPRKDRDSFSRRLYHGHGGPHVPHGPHGRTC